MTKLTSVKTAEILQKRQIFGIFPINYVFNANTYKISKVFKNEIHKTLLIAALFNYKDENGMRSFVNGRKF